MRKDLVGYQRAAGAYDPMVDVNHCAVSLMTMRTYGQYYPIAKALDVAGDRWTFLRTRHRAPARHPGRRARDVDSVAFAKEFAA